MSGYEIGGLLVCIALITVGLVMYARITPDPKIVPDDEKDGAA